MERRGGSWVLERERERERRTAARVFRREESGCQYSETPVTCLTLWMKDLKTT